MYKNSKNHNKVSVVKKKPARTTRVTAVVKIHPESLIYLNKGHPWVTLDSFSKEFPRSIDFLKVENGNEFIVLINDPEHPTVRARFWSRIEKHQTFHFALHERINQALTKREQIINSGDRNNYILVFGEADFLPGLTITFLNNNILIQTQMPFWNKHKKQLFKILDERFDRPYYFWQNRYGENKSIKPVGRYKIKPFHIKEFGCSFKIDFTLGEDFGIYTDMSAIRQTLAEYITDQTSLLNLYSYTGAFSLFAIKNNALKTTSVDLSKRYLEVLEENIKHSELDLTKHHSDNLEVKVALKKYIKNKEKYNVIICDPPSFSRGKKSYQKSLNDYKILIPQFYKILEKEGYLICFINTHQIAMSKFRKTFNTYLEDNKDLKLIKYLTLKDDCPRLSNFSEGDYIKGIVLQKK